MNKATLIKKYISERNLGDIPEGQVRTTDKTCRKCKYSSQIGAGDHYVGCMYADIEHHCRTLEPDYVSGYCKHFTKGKREPIKRFNNNNLYIEMSGRAIHEK